MNMSDFSMLDAMDQQLIKNVEQYVMQNMSRGQISLEELASAMGMGRVPFFHRIRNLTAKTPAELVRDMRLKHACILLKRTNINMSELATNIGFMTAENFINIFREKFGMTPLDPADISSWIRPEQRFPIRGRHAKGGCPIYKRQQHKTTHVGQRKVCRHV